MSIVAAIMVPHPPLIVPAVGQGQERGIQATIDAYHEAARFVAESKPETIVLSSPHSVMYADYFHISPGESACGDFGQFGAPEVQIHADYDTELVSAICRLCEREGIPAGTDGERSPALDHGTMVPLYFINQYWTDYKLVRVGLAGLPLGVHKRLGAIIARAIGATHRRVAYVASGDLSHKLLESGPYGYSPYGPQYDERIMDAMGRADWDDLISDRFNDTFCERAAECGHRSFVMMSGALANLTVTPHRLSYEGPFGVGYGVCEYEVRCYERQC